MTILLWSPKGAGLHYGGPGMSAFRLYTSPEASNLNVELAHGFTGQPPHPEVFEREHLIAPIFRMQDSQAIFEPRPIPYLYMRFLTKAHHWIRRNMSSYDVFHGLTGYAYSVDPAVQAERAGVPAAIKIAAHRRDLEEKSRWDQLSGRLRRRRQSLRRISAVIAISHDIRKELIGHGLSESKVVYIPNGVDVNVFHPAPSVSKKSETRSRLGIEDRFTILFAGSVVARKEPHMIVEALAKVRRMGADVQLVLAGPCDESAFVRALRSRIQELGLKNHVHWLGMVVNMPTVYRAADVFCLPSTIEGLSNAVIEALASGLPVIAAPVSGNVDIIDGCNGQLVPGNPAAYTTAIFDYHSDPNLLRQHGEAARATVLRRLDARRVLAAHTELFRIMMRGGEPASASIE